MEQGPFPIFTFIQCRNDESCVSKRAAFPDDAAALQHARQRLLDLGSEWISIVVAGGPEEALEFMGAWDRKDGSVHWSPITL